MKLSKERLMAIATMTRRRMLKLSTMATFGMALPAVVTAAGPSPPVSPRVRKYLGRLRADLQFRGKAIMTPDLVLPQLKLNADEKTLIAGRLKLLKRVGMGLAFEVMRHQKSLRPLLLNPRNVNYLVFSKSKGLQRALTDQETVQIDNLKGTYESISDIILGYDSSLSPGVALVVDDIVAGVRDDFRRGDADFMCATDQGCQNSGCGDLGTCSDDGCTNGGCGNIGCSHPDCDNGSCSNDLCDNKPVKSCNFDCSDSKKECYAGATGLADEIYETLAKALESAIDRGPEMGFLVRADGKTIQGKAFLNVAELKQSLRSRSQPAGRGLSPDVRPQKRIKP